MAERKKLLVIGNGFDLHHGMKTRYDDFIDFVKEYIKDKDSVFLENKISPAYMQLFENVEKNNFVKCLIGYSEQINGWIDFEIVIKNIVTYFDKFIESQLKKRKIAGVDLFEMTEGKDGFSNLVEQTFDKILCFGEDNTYGFLLEYKSDLYGIDKTEIIKSLRAEFEDFRGFLRNYLKFVEPCMRKESGKYLYNISNQINEIGADYLITFNYTDTYKLYDIPIENVTHIHGALDEALVLGYNDEDEESLDFVYFKKYFQCIKYRTDLLFENYKYFTVADIHGRRVFPTVYFFGHSLDETDEEYLKKLFGDGKHKVIIYYLDDDDFEKKVINVIKLLKKEDIIVFFCLSLEKTLFGGLTLSTLFFSH